VLLNLCERRQGQRRDRPERRPWQITQDELSVALQMTYVEYLCTKCKATDTNKYFENEAVWPVTTCWKCKAGQGSSVGQMLETGQGMHRVVQASK